MSLPIHHLNCTTLHPPCARLINGKGSLFSRGLLVCHCLLVETKEGLVLVDTGLGLRYISNPKLLGSKNFFFIHAPLDPAETAARQIVELGFAVEDVRHIILTHLDLDHAGGLPDFPDAQVHLLAHEYEAAVRSPTPKESRRYIADEWGHGPQWVIHPCQGEKWYEFDHVQEILPEILLVPLIGHTRGHCGVAVKTTAGWFFHCGDAYVEMAEIVDPRRITLGTKWYQRTIPFDGRTASECRRQVQELIHDHSGEVTTCCSHDPAEFDQFSTCH